MSDRLAGDFVAVKSNRAAAPVRNPPVLKYRLTNRRACGDVVYGVR